MGALVHCAYAGKTLQENLAILEAVGRDDNTGGTDIVNKDEQPSLSPTDQLRAQVKLVNENPEITGLGGGANDDDTKTADEALGGLDAEEDDELTLISCDEENPAKFSISRKAALMCNLVKNIIEGDKTAKEI